jgi:hypothetical protein
LTLEVKYKFPAAVLKELESADQKSNKENRTKNILKHVSKVIQCQHLVISLKYQCS